LLARVPGQFGDNHPKAARTLKIAKHSLDTVAEVLGTDVASVRAALADGGTIADLAGDQTQAVVDALTADANAAIDEAVASGKLPAERAEQAKERVAGAIERFVNEPHPRLGGVHRP
jgi:predicted trehalose synthase